MQKPETPGFFAVQASIAIDAPVERVWSVLVDLKRYSEWNTFVPSMQSSFQVGDPLTMQVQMRKNLRTQSTLTITTIDPYRMLAWKARTPPWLLSVERSQMLLPIDEQSTEYRTREVYSGIFAPVLKILFGKDLQRGFQVVAHDLKDRAEQGNTVL